MDNENIDDYDPYENMLEEEDWLMALMRRIGSENDFEDELVQEIYNQCTLYVPSGTEDTYRQHSIFGRFKEVIGE